MLIDNKKALEIQRAMAKELSRARKGLYLPGHPRPFFVSHLLHAKRGLSVWGRYGSVFASEPFAESDLYAEVRVGSYRMDQSLDGGLSTEMSERESFNWVEGPQDLNPDALRYSLWKLTQFKYEEALQDYYDKKKVLVEQHLRQKGPSFSKERRIRRNQRIDTARFPQSKWEAFVRDASGLFRKHKELVDPYVRLRGTSNIRIFANSEGSHFIAQESFYEAIVEAWYLADDGVYLNASRLFYGRKLEDLPKRAAIEKAIAALVRDLKGLAKSRPLEPYAGPALLSGYASGLMFHEAIGHRLEGERLTARSEGQTFKNKVGRRILPAGVDVVDDPTMTSFEGKPLYGHYRIDDEGVMAQPTRLVKDGVLETFLLSRACVQGFTQSNGHGRHERHQDPMARMANLVVKSADAHEWNDLKKMLMEEVRRRKLPYGIIVRGVAGGETRTDRYEFQAFKGIPTHVCTVDPRTGKETRVRDVAFIGTPLAAIQRILAFGRDYEVDNSYCYAESGSVPVATVAPSMLVGELELQRSSTRSYRQPILPFPPMGPA